MKQHTLALWIAASLTLAAQQAQAENLLQVYQQAKGYDAQFKALESGYMATLEKKPQALSALKPQVSLSGSASQAYEKTPYDAGTPSGSADYNISHVNYALNLSKSLYNKSLDAQTEQADAVIAQAGSGLDAERENLIMRVANGYFGFLLAQDNLQLARTEKEAINRQLEQTKAYFDAGRSAITDVKEAESRFDLATAQEINAANQLDLAREQLRVLTGGFYQTLNGPASNLPLTVPTPQDIEQWVQTAKASNKELAASKKAIEVAQKEVERQRAGKKPTVNLVASQTGSKTEGDPVALDPESYDASVGVQVNVPLYTGGAVSSKIREAQHSLRQAQQQHDFQARKTEQQARNAFLTVQSSISQVTANQRALTSAETAAEATQAGFEVGTRTAVDVLTSLRNVFSARRDYANARYNYLLSTLSLKQAAGTLSDKDIAAMNTLLTDTPKTLAKNASQQDAAAGETTDTVLDPANADYQYYAKPETPAEPAAPAAAPAKSNSKRK
jgi:outer membrane protein